MDAMFDRLDLAALSRAQIAPLEALMGADWPDTWREPWNAAELASASRRADSAGWVTNSWVTRRRLGSSWANSFMSNATVRGKLGRTAGKASRAFKSMGSAL